VVVTSASVAGSIAPPIIASADRAPAAGVARRGALLPLTSLRFIAAGCIVLSHLQGYLGVPAFRTHDPYIFMQAVSFFFVLSGFILAYRYPSLSAGGAPRFIVSRIARIWPMHVVATLLFVALVPAYLQDQLFTKTIGTTLANLFLVHTWLPYGPFNSSYNLVAWSVSTEMFFYICFPFLIWRWRSTWHWKLGLTLALALGMICLAAFQAQHLPELMRGPFSLVYDSPLARLWEFTLGIATATLWTRLRSRVQISRAVATLVEVGVVCLAVGMVHWSAGIATALSDRTQTGAAGSIWLQLAGLTSLPFAAVIGVMALERGWLSRLLSLSPLVFLGEISYSMYLLQTSLLIVVMIRAPQITLVPPLLLAIVFVGSLILASYIAWAMIEVPCRRGLVAVWDRLMRRPSPSPTSAATPGQERASWRRLPRRSRTLAIIAIIPIAVALGCVPVAPAPAVPPPITPAPTLATMAMVQGHAEGAVNLLGPTPPTLGVTPEINRNDLAGNPLTITGWAVDTQETTALAGVFVLLDNSASYWALYGYDRPDVAAYLQVPDLRAVGYLGSIPAAALSPGPHIIRLVAVLRGEASYEYIGTIPLVVQ
jgi:peptidoglycan/LPS O-acetylase OafA/YrhL